MPDRPRPGRKPTRSSSSTATTAQARTRCWRDCFRFVCCNGLVCGTVSNDIRIPHKGNVQGEVIEGAFRVLEDFEAIENSTAAMKALALDEGEERAFAAAALALRYGERHEGRPPAPITVEQMVEARRPEDIGAQPLGDVPAGPGERHPGWPAGSQHAGQAHPHPRGREHRSRREPEPGAVGAGRGDEKAQGLTASRRTWESPALRMPCSASGIEPVRTACKKRARRPAGSWFCLAKRGQVSGLT